MRSIRYGFLLSSISLAIAAACGSESGSAFDPPGGGSSSGEAGASSSGASSGFTNPDGSNTTSSGGDPVGRPIKIEPVDQVVSIDVGGTPAPITFVAKIADF